MAPDNGGDRSALVTLCAGSRLGFRRVFRWRLPITFTLV
ncbi:hypothetical protein BH24CHL2_BH24CHL2_5880 [soil metagenome]|jgi:Na+-translocating ferredoxin:NAD+ oxidoreductase RnfD subunit